MFVKGTSWRKKLLGGTVLYLIFLSLGLIYAARIFHEGHLMVDAASLILPLVGLAVVWARYKKHTDSAFAAWAAERKASAAAQPKTGAAVLYILLFHVLFVVSVLGFKAALDGLALARETEIILAAMAATAVACAAVFALVGVQERRGRATA